MIAVVTDSASDLPKHLAAARSISVVPAIVVIGSEQYADGQGLSRKVFYDQLPDMNAPPTTAAPASGTFAELYQELLDDGANQVFSIHIAGGLSGMYNAARLGAEGFGGRVVVHDSGQLSMGLGFQAMAAAELARAGGGMEALQHRVRGLQKRLKVVAMLDSLEYLRRSGRVSSLRAYLGAALRIRAFMQIERGEVIPLARIRTRKRALSHLGELLAAHQPIESWAMLHTNAEPEAREFAENLEVGLPSPEFINVTTVIGTHVGPNALGFAAVRAE
jgi:DegV family protein with EDD domain